LKKSTVRSKIGFLILLGTFNSVFGNYQFEVNSENFFDAIRKMNFPEAKLLGEKLQKKTGNNCYLEFMMWYSKDSTQNRNVCVYGFTEGPILNELIRGYKELYVDDGQKVNAFKAFSNSIQIANRKKKENALKVSIISMLNLLRKEIFLGTDKYSLYIKHYKELKLDNIDKVYLALYEVIFSTKENSNYRTTANYDKNISILDNLFKYMPEDSPFRPRYYFEKGIQYKIKGDYVAALKSFEKAKVDTVSILKKYEFIF
jgi:tetratricopeptide (TPR) repeat protein